ncbi:hypothetical protein QYE76_038923 [Lolium multiflorum]|uniref:RNase H type-1 domain-containing protein n=1 Tax=Lolium multiflorum TaxID=4521 RepID=A0AAD8WRQ8_LOLMU|nr:hypothetical protein QYE76_038923 [Lolium multiflorum]
MELQNTGPPDLSRTWTMNFDGSKRLEGAGAGVVLISPEGDKLKYVLRMTFPNASNNEAEYEALIHGMKMAKACGATRLKIFGDSQLVAQQVMNQCDAVNDSMMAYKEVYNELEKLFDGCEVNHISRLSNDEADVLANIGSQCLAVPPGVFWEEITERSTKSIKSKKKEKKPSGATKEEQEEEEDQDLVMMIQIPWMQTYISYILRKEIPDDPVEARRVIRRSKAFTVIKGELYKRSISGVLQRSSAKKVSIMTIGKKVGIHPKKVFNHFFGYRRNLRVNSVDTNSSAPYLLMNFRNNLGQVKLRVADLKHDKGKSGASYQLSSDKIMDPVGILEFLH